MQKSLLGTYKNDFYTSVHRSPLKVPQSSMCSREFLACSGNVSAFMHGRIYGPNHMVASCRSEASTPRLHHSRIEDRGRFWGSSARRRAVPPVLVLAPAKATSTSEFRKVKNSRQSPKRNPHRSVSVFGRVEYGPQPAKSAHSGSNSFTLIRPDA